MLAAIRKITVTKYYNANVDSMNDPLVQRVSYDDTKTNISRAKKWWYLAYTLIHNPDLIELRKRDGVETNDKLYTDVSQGDFI